MRSARVVCLRGVGMSQGEEAPLSSSANRALDVDLVIGGSSSKREDRLFAKLVEAPSPEWSAGGELPKRDMATTALWNGKTTSQGR